MTMGNTKQQWTHFICIFKFTLFCLFYIWEFSDRKILQVAIKNLNISKVYFDILGSSSWHSSAWSNRTDNSDVK